MMREYEGDAAPEGAELEAFLSAPKHHLARLIRDLFSEEAAGTTMQVGRPQAQLLCCGCMHASKGGAWGEEHVSSCSLGARRRCCTREIHHADWSA